MSGRAERRRRARAEAKGKHRKPPVLIAGDGIAAASIGEQFEARPSADLPPKQPGKHRWIAAGSWVISDVDAAGAFDADQMKFLDNENLIYLGIGCWDCEEPLGKITHDSRCPAAGE